MLKSTPEVKLTEMPAEAPKEGLPTLRTLFESEESNLLRFAFSLTGRRAVAEEIVQEIFLQLHTKWSEVDDPRAWLFRSARNQAFHYLRKSRREPLEGDICSDRSVHSDRNVRDGTVDGLEKLSCDAPDDMIAQMETLAQLRQLVSQLPEKDRRLVHLKYYEDLKYRDISQRTGLTISNVGFRLHQVIKKLAAGLLPRGGDEES